MKSMWDTLFGLFKKNYNVPPPVDMEFAYCVLGSCWGPWERKDKDGKLIGNNGGFIIQYGAKNFGFGEITFIIEKDGTLTCDTETGPRAMAERCLIEMSKRARLRDDWEDSAAYKDREPVVKSDNKHGERNKIWDELECAEGTRLKAACDGYSQDKT